MQFSPALKREHGPQRSPAAEGQQEQPSLLQVHWSPQLQPAGPVHCGQAECLPMTVE